MKHQRVHRSLRAIAVAAVVLGGVWAADPGPSVLAQQDAGYVVIVNASNPTPAMARKELGKIFLKKREEWPTGFAITVVDQAAESAVRERFSTDVLGKEPTAVEAYWSKLIFSGMGVPPIKLGSDAEVIDFVGNNVGSIGYVSSTAALPGSVKKLEVGR